MPGQFILLGVVRGLLVDGQTRRRFRHPAPLHQVLPPLAEIVQPLLEIMLGMIGFSHLKRETD